MTKKNTQSTDKAGKQTPPVNKPAGVIQPVAKVDDDANENLAGPEKNGDPLDADIPVPEVAVNHLDKVREFPEIPADVKAVQVKGGIEYFKDVDRRTMRVVAYRGELCKQVFE